MLKHFLFFFIFSINVFSSEEAQNLATQSFDHTRWKTLISLVDNEINTIQKNRYSGAELKHRLFELYSEKIKLIKEKENYNLLKSSMNDSLKAKKETFFEGSQAQYKTAQTYALGIISAYPNYNKMAEVYYALAINSRDYGNSLDTEKFLKQSILKSLKDSKTMYNAKTALAEHYYNNKKYHDAVFYYNDVLKNSENEWYGKHLYNASWSYLKERNFKKALDLMKLSYQTSKNKKYVSMEEQVIMAIGIFFVQADATFEGISFFETNTVPASPHLLNLALSSMNKNNFNITEEVLKAALKDAKKQKDVNAEMKVRLTQLDIYTESKKEEEYFSTANSILELHKKYKLNPDDLFLAQNKIKEVSGRMQTNLVKDKTKDPIVYKKEDYKKIIRYFDILSSLDRANKKLYRYYQGETALSIHEYQAALKYYVRSIMNAKAIKNYEDPTRKSLEAMLTIIELAKLSKEKENEYTIFAFKNFVLFYPKSDKSQTIYQKLFNKYFELNKTNKALNTLLIYKFHYPQDESIHREMLTQVLDRYIKEKNTNHLAFWIRKVEKGYLNFTNEYIQNSIAVLGSLLFDKYQSLEKKGEIKNAMKGYESIYDSKQYPIRIKAEAAYAIAALSLEQNKPEESYKWFKKSIEIYDSKDLIKITPSIFTLAKGYRLLQNFDFSTEVAFLISRKFCTDLYKNKEDFYQLINENALIQKTSMSDLIKNEEELSHCKLTERLISRTQNENMERLIFSDRYQDVLFYFKSHSQNSSLKIMADKYFRYKFYQNPEAIAKDLDSIQTLIDLSAIKTQYQNVLDYVKKVNEFNFIFTQNDKFDEEKFNQELEQYFAIIGELNTEAMALSKKSGPREVIMIRNVLAKPYFSLVKAVRNFSPRGVDNLYLEGFKKGMRQITESVLSKGLQIDREKSDFLMKNNYFFEIQKNVIVGEGKEELLKQELHFHSAILFSNTLDIAKTNGTRVITGQ